MTNVLATGTRHCHCMLQTGVVFDPLSEDFFKGAFDTYRRMREEAPVYYNPDYDFYALSRHTDVAAALKDFATFSSAAGVDLPSIQSGMKPPVDSVTATDPPAHGRLRSVINKLFTPRAIESRRQLIADQIDRHLAAVGTQFDVVQDFSALFPAEVIAQMLGVPAEFRPQIRQCVEASLQREPGHFEMTDTAAQVLMTTMAMYGEVARQRRAKPADDMISALAAPEVGLSDTEIAVFATTLGSAGAETVTKLIGNAAVTFWRHPKQWHKLLTDRTKIPAAVEELLRFDGPAQYVLRMCTTDAFLHGTAIPAGKPVFLLLGSANRDSDAFTDPDDFNIERVRGEAQPLGLGYGIHSCLGAALARLESTMALGALLDFMPRYEVLEDGLTRVTELNVTGWNTVPVRVLP